jgi:hypothetical protein
MRTMFFSKTFLLIILFIILVVGGRYAIFSLHGRTTEEKVESTPAEVEKSEPETKQSATATTKPQSENSTTSCIADIAKEVKDTGTEYDKGSVLVSFKKGVAYVEAKEALSTYNIMVKNESQAKATYDTNRLITGAVTPGEEFSKICQARLDARVQYAGLNTIFKLHQ